MATVTIDMQVTGIARVKQALQSVQQVVERLEQKTLQDAQKGSRARVKAAQEGMRAEKSALDSLSQLTKTARDRMLSRENMFERARTQIAKQSAESRRSFILKFEKEHTAALVAEGKKREQLAQAEARVKEREATRAGRALEAARRREDRAADAARRKEERAADAVRRRGERAADAVRKKDERAARKKEEREAKESARALRSNIVGYAGAVGRGVSNVAGAGLRLGRAAVALGGGFTISDIARRSMSNEASAISLANRMFKPEDADQAAYLSSKNLQRFSPKQLGALATKVQGISGIDKGELLGGWSEYVARSGDWETFAKEENQDTLVDLAKLARATGSDVGDIMSAAGQLRSQDKKLSPKEMLSTMQNVVGQSLVGDVDLRDMARIAGRATGSSSLFVGGSTTENQRKLLGLGQIAMRSAGSVGDAGKAVAHFGDDVAKSAGVNEKKHGMKLRGEGGKLLAPSEIMTEYFRVAEGDLTKMGAGKGRLGLGMESIKVAQSLTKNYEGAIEEARAGNVDQATRDKLKLGNKSDFSQKELAAIGAEGVRREVAKLETAGYDKEHVERSFQEVANSSQERMNRAIQNISAVLEDKAVPMIEKLAESFERNGPKIEAFLSSKEFDNLIKAIEKTVGFFANHPFAGMAGLVTASILKELVAVKIGQIIKNWIEKAPVPGGGTSGAGRGGSTTAPGGAPEKPPGAAGMIVAGVTGYYHGFQMGSDAGEWLQGMGTEDYDKASAGADKNLAYAGKVNTLRKRIKAGGAQAITSDDRRMLMDAKFIVHSELDAAERAQRKDVGFFEEVHDFLSGDFDSKDRKDAANDRVRNARKAVQQFEAFQAEFKPQLTAKLQASDVVDAPAIRQQMASAVSGGIQDGVIGGAKGDPGDPKRNKSHANR